MKKYKFLSFIMIVIIIMGSAINVGATTHKLNMTDRRQEKTNWCWAAVVLMVIDYLNSWEPLPSQSDIVTTLKGSAVNEGATDSEVTSVLGWYMVSTTYTPTAIQFSTIKNMLSGWYSPIAVGIRWSNSGGGHAQIIYGYEENNDIYQGVYVLDPKMSGTQRSYYNFSDYCNNSTFYWNATWYNNKKKS